MIKARIALYKLLNIYWIKNKWITLVLSLNNSSNKKATLDERLFGKAVKLTSLTHHQFGSQLREFQRSSSLYVSPSSPTSTQMG